MLELAYRLETDILRLVRRDEELAEAIRREKFLLRAARQARIEYEGSLRALWNKLSGKHPDVLEQLTREERHAEEGLNRLLRQQESEKARLAQLKEQRAGLPESAELCNDENCLQWAALEKDFCGEALIPLLKETAEALEEYRQMLRGEFPILSVEEQQRIAAAPVQAAEHCSGYLKRLERAEEMLGSPTSPSGFFSNPAGYLVAAAKHNQLTRAEEAAEQTLRLLRRLENHP